MSLLTVILDYQHFGKPGKNDKGAFANGKHETDLTWKYIEAAKAELKSKGHRVVVLKSGYYGTRHRRAIALAGNNPERMHAYIACHVNAGGGDYSVCLYDHRSKNGIELADDVRTELGKAFPQIRRHLTKPASPVAWTNGFNTIKGVFAGPSNLSGVCFEPAFIDNLKHQSCLTPDGLERMGRALAAGCIAWSNDHG